MKFVTMILVVLFISSFAFAEKPVFESEPEQPRIPCGLNNVFYDWDFSAGSHDFSTSACDETGGGPVWEHGATTYVADTPGTVWGTVLEGDYLTDAGESLTSPAFEVTTDAYLMEIVHYYDMENLWDGGNVTVNGEVIAPMVGYPGMISVPGDWHSWCVDFELGFTGLESGWFASCFDLSSYIGQTIQVSFDFGSDDMYTEAGWYLASVKVGTDQVTATEDQTWSGAKSIYR